MNKEYTYTLENEVATTDFAAKLAAYAHAPLTIYFYGDLGAGKTTFIRAFLQSKGVQGRIKSPTYTLIEVYELTNGFEAIHFDFYRINSVKELDNLAIHEYFKSTSICLIEWPEKTGNYLPAPDIECYLNDNHNDQRILRVVAMTEDAKKLLNNVR